MHGRACLAYLLDLAALLLCYEYPVQSLLCMWFISNDVVGCVHSRVGHSRVGLIAPLLCYEYPVQGLFC